MAPGDISPLRLRKKIAQFAKFVMLNCFDPDTGEFDFIKGLMKPSADGSYTFGLANIVVDHTYSTYLFLHIVEYTRIREVT